jgi:hypothetical protein
MEAIDEVFSTSRLSQTQTPPSVAWRSSGGTSGNTDTFVSSSMAGGAGAGGAGSAGGSGGGSSGDGSGSGSSPGGPQDSWGTTQESPAEIARRLVLSNQELEQQAKQLGQGECREGGCTARCQQLPELSGFESGITDLTAEACDHLHT